MICECGKGEAVKEIEKDGKITMVCYKCYLQWKYGNYENILGKKQWKRLYEKQEEYFPNTKQLNLFNNDR